MADSAVVTLWEPNARIKSLVHLASDVNVEYTIPPKRYFRSGIEMERMAKVYLDEGNLEKAFILYTKYITLFVEKLPKHPQYNQISPKERQDARQKLGVLFNLAEQIKGKLKVLFVADYKKWKAEEAARKTKEQEDRLRAEEDKRKQREDEVKRQQQQLIAQNTVLPTPSIIPYVLPTDPTIDAGYPTPPTVSTNQVRQDIEMPPAYEKLAPQVPPYTEIKTDGFPAVPSPVSLPPLSPNTVLPSSTVPKVDRTSKPDYSYSRQDSNPIDGLRRMYVPHEIISRFLTLASSNTRQNKETCGILTGKLAKNIFHITHLIIPKQTATPDSCTTLSEEELFDVQDKYDLITLGWIHTHPSQTSFLSSVDLHTQFSYQMLMPEAVAIVIAPKYDQMGVYRLTSGYGLSFIGSCHKGGFHPHPKEPPLFEESRHAQLDKTMTLKVVDLR